MAFPVSKPHGGRRPPKPARNPSAERPCPAPGGSKCSATGNSSGKRSPASGLRVSRSAAGRGRRITSLGRECVFGAQARVRGARTPGGPGAAAVEQASAVSPRGRRPAVLACAPPRRSTPGTWGMRADSEAALSGPTRGNQGPARGRCELRKPLGPAGQSAAGPGDRCGPGGQARFPGRASPWNPSFLTPAWGALGAAALL